MEHGAIPVISPIGIGATGEHFNINGDTAAAAIASAMKGKLVLISDIPGVMETINDQTIIHKKLTKTEIEALITSGVIHGGMIPKVRSALDGLAGWCRRISDYQWSYANGFKEIYCRRRSRNKNNERGRSPCLIH